MNSSPLFNSVENFSSNSNNIGIPSSPPINIQNYNNNNGNNKQHHKRRSSNNGTTYNNSSPLTFKSASNQYSSVFDNNINSGINFYNGSGSSTGSSKQQTPLILSENYNNSMIPDPLEYHNSIDDNELFNKNQQKLKQNTSNSNPSSDVFIKKFQQYQQQLLLQEEDEEYHDTNSDLGFLTVTSKEDLIVCLNVLKKEIHQFKNLSQSLLSRLMSLERGVGNEKSMRSSPIPSRFMNDGFDNDNGILSSLTSSPSHSPPNIISNNFSSQFTQYQNNNNNLVSPTTTTTTTNNNKINTEILLSNAINEIHRLIEKQKQYDNILSQREKIWDLELNKLTMSILSKFNSNNQQQTSSRSSSIDSSPKLNENSFLNEGNEHLYIEQQQQQKSLNNSNESNLVSSKPTIDNNSMIGRIRYQIDRIYQFFSQPRSISFWKKVLIIGIIIILWPMIAQYLWKGINSILTKRRLKISQTKLNTLSNQSNIKPNKLRNILPSTSSLLPPSSTLRGTIPTTTSTNSNGNGNGILSRIFKRKNITNTLNSTGGIISNGNGNSSGSGVNKNFGAPDIVKAIIQGASTGDGGTTVNSNLTNTISSMNTMLNSVIPTAAAVAAVAANSGSGTISSSSTINPISSLSNGSSSSLNTNFTASGSINSNSGVSSISSISSSLPNSLSNNIIGNSATSNLINNLTPTAISSLNLPSNSNTSSSMISSISNDIIPTTINSSIPSSLLSPSRLNNITSSRTSNQSNSVMFKMVKNLLSKKSSY